MYAGDSFFTLGAAERVGLVIVSALLALAMLGACRVVARRTGWPLRLGLWAVLFAGFVALSPQVYYQYYRLIFEGLPAQWVIRLPPDPGPVALLGFTGPANLSAHSSGLLGWAMLAVIAGTGRSRPGGDRRR